MFIAYYIRVHFQESPIFEEIKAKGAMTKNPWKEAFLSANIKFVLIATIIVLGEGVVWYSGQFWALHFLQQVIKVDALTTHPSNRVVSGMPASVHFLSPTPCCRAGFPPQTAKRWPGFRHKPRNQKSLRRNTPETGVR